MKQRWSVQNHIKTVHAIAVCNLVECTMGLVAEATIPSNLRWLPMGMDIKYHKKCIGKLSASSKIHSSLFQLDSYPGKIDVPVEVFDENKVVVTSANVSIKHIIIASIYFTFITTVFECLTIGDSLDIRKT